jgi:hypothetical protein
MTNTLRPRVTRIAMATVAMLLGMLLVGAAAHAATYSLTGRVPRYGSQTYDAQDFYTTPSFLDINYKYTTNPYESYVKAVKCSNFANISTAKHFAANNHTEKVIAASVLDNTCFNINIDSPSNAYWDFAATIRA